MDERERRAENLTTMVTDATAPSGQPVQQGSRTTVGDDYFSAWTGVNAGQTYCVRAGVRWEGGGRPFIGIERNNGSEVDWLFGVDYTSAVFGAITVVSDTVSGWQSLSRQIVMPTGTTRARLSNELWGGRTKAGANLAYFDDVHIASGACSAWADRAGNPATMVTDVTAPSGQPVQQVSRTAVGGDYLSPWTGVRAGQTYCVRDGVRWEGGGWPFIGIERNNGSEVDWLFGVAYPSAVFGAITVVSDSISGWQSMSRQIVMPAGTTQVRLSDELYGGRTKAGANLAYFDDVHIASGACGGG